MIPGIPVNFGGTDYVLPPMNLRIQLEEPTKSDVELLQKNNAADQSQFLNAAVNVILACAKRNYPDISRDTIIDGVDSGDLPGLVVALLTKTGFTPRPLASPATATNLSPEPASSASSMAPLDGSLTTSSTG